MKNFVLGLGTILALFCSFLIAGFVSAVFFWVLAMTKAIIKWFKHPAHPPEETYAELKSVEKFLESKHVFVRDPSQYQDKNNNRIDDLDETR